jgi:LacI family transcriptional regulator
VSYVINDLQDSQVSEETRQRVLKAVSELGYQPDAMAQSLRLGTSQTIGLLIPDIDNPHYWHIAKGVEIEAQRNDYDLLLISAGLDPARELHSIRALSRRRIDGLILLLTFIQHDHEHILNLIRHKKPLVLVDDRTRTVDTVRLDERRGATAVMEHLLALGHRRIGFIYGVATQGIGGLRLAVYRDRMAAAGQPVDDRLIVSCGTTPEDGYQAAVQLLSQPERPTALVVINDLLAMGALRAAADLGLRVPQDVSVASFDDIDLAVYTIPRLTTVGINASAMGQAAAQMIFRRLQNPTQPVQETEFAGQLIVRDSTAPPPV